MNKTEEQLLAIHAELAKTDIRMKKGIEEIKYELRKIFSLLFLMLAGWVMFCLFG